MFSGAACEGGERGKELKRGAMGGEGNKLSEDFVGFTHRTI